MVDLTVDRSYSVYVVRLKKDVLNERKFKEANPDYTEKKGCVYVGMTGLTPLERYRNHKEGHKSNKYVKKYGDGLITARYERLNPMTREEAEKKEVELAEELRELGFAVWQH